EFAKVIPPLTKEWTQEMVTQGISFKDGAFYKGKIPQSIAIYNGPGKEITFSDLYPFNELERTAISWMSAAIDRNLSTIPLLSTDYADVYYHRQDNGQVMFHPENFVLPGENINLSNKIETNLVSR